MEVENLRCPEIELRSVICEDLVLLSLQAARGNLQVGSAAVNVSFSKTVLTMDVAIALADSKNISALEDS